MRIIFYRNPAGEAVVLDWIHEQNAKVQAKIFRDLKLLEHYGLAFGEPDIELIDKKDRIWEIKTRHSGNIYRIFFTVFEDILLLNGFQKKTQKTPVNEIETAVRRLKQYREYKKTYGSMSRKSSKE